MTSPNMDSALQTFVGECGELLQQMEDALLRLETEPENQDIIDAIALLALDARLMAKLISSVAAGSLAR